MSEDWAKRQRQTNKLVRAAATHLFKKKGSPSTDQLYGLCKLTWITKSYLEDDAGYIESTKVPALEDIFGRDYDRRSITDVATDISSQLKSKDIGTLIQAHTGFTNFYKPYRNTARKWISDHRKVLIPLFRAAHTLKTDAEGLALTKAIQLLPGVPKANHEEIRMRPEYLLTPVFFSLDKRIRFPLINGNQGVQKLLSKLGVTNAPLSEQYERMIELYGRGGIVDAADLDQVGSDLPEFIGASGHVPTKKLLQKKPTTGKALPLKDAADIKALQKARVIVNRRLHNTLTNKLREKLARFTLLEGSNKSAQFDVIIKSYNSKSEDLLVEVKSSIDLPDVRMAIGQLFSYWHTINGNSKPHLAVLLPTSPNIESQKLLRWLGIGVMWFGKDHLETNAKWLQHLCHA